MGKRDQLSSESWIFKRRTRTLLQQQDHIRPRRKRIRTIKRIVPIPPLGQYPQFLLWFHLGIAPINKRMRITKRMIVILNLLFLPSNRKLSNRYENASQEKLKLTVCATSPAAMPQRFGGRQLRTAVNQAVEN